MEYPWFKKLSLESGLEQGDLVPNCPIIIPPSKVEVGDELEVEVKLIDSIVLSQSCDLVNGKVEMVLVCPFYPLKIFLESLPPEQQSKKGKKRNVENLRKGYLPSYHLLNKYPEYGLMEDYQVVDFRNVYGVQFSMLQNLVQSLSERVRLQPPYREHLSQAFARYFMRVGLPQDLRVEGY